jgi:hypothetical protein
MRVKAAALGITGLTLAVVMTACDAVAEYTVVNETDRPLITRALFEGDCQMARGNSADYLPEQQVEPFEAYEFFDIYGAGIGSQGVKCVQVLTSDRRIILAAPYEEGKTYEVKEPVRIIGEPAPEISDLPGQSGPNQILEGIREEPVENAIAIGFFLILIGGTLAGFFYAIFITVRFFYRHYRGTT